MAYSVGVVKELWRYPVKSMAGELLPSAKIESYGMLGDRCWALRDEISGELTVVRKTPGLLRCKAEYIGIPEEDYISQVCITLPCGRETTSLYSKVNQELSRMLGKPVTLWPLQPKSNWRHYRTAGIQGAKDMKQLFSSNEIPDYSSISWRLLSELMFFTTPLGRYYDAYPLHILSTASLQKMADYEPNGDFSSQRFRPNLLVESNHADAGFDDFSWVGGRLYIGDTVIKCESRTVRCSMPAEPQVGKDKDNKVLKALNVNTNRYLGVNATVVRSGSIKVGDEVIWEPLTQSKVGERIGKVSASVKSSLVQSMLNTVDRINEKVAETKTRLERK